MSEISWFRSSLQQAAPAAKLQTQTGNRISVGGGGEETRLQILTIFESHFSYLKTARCWLGRVLTGARRTGRAGMLIVRSLSVDDIHIFS